MKVGSLLKVGNYNKSKGIRKHIMIFQVEEVIK